MVLIKNTFYYEILYVIISHIKSIGGFYMAKFEILCDSACDLPDSLIEAKSIDIIPFYISFDQENYLRERVDITLDDFYEKLYHNFPKTSLPSVQDYINKFTPYAKEGKSLICITLTSKFSGSYQSAVNAREMIIEEYPDADITVLDSRLCTVLQGLLVLQVARMRDADLSLQETLDKIEALISTGRIMYTIGTLDYLQKSGRIGKAGALAGNILKLKPLIVVRDGELQPYGTIRGRKKSLKKIMDMTKDYFEELGDSPSRYSWCMAYGAVIDESMKVAEQLTKQLDIHSEIQLFKIGSTIGTSCGPDPVGIAFIKNYEEV